MPPTISTRRRSSRPEEPKQSPPNDAYTGILIISLIAQIAGVVFFYLDYSQYPEAKPQVKAAATK